MIIWRGGLAVGVFLCSFCISPRSWAQPAPIGPDKSALPHHPNMIFEANLGQGERGADFLARGGGATVSLHSAGATLMFGALSPSVVRKDPRPEGRNSPAAILRLQFLNTNDKVEAKPNAPLAAKVSDYGGNDPHQWLRDIPTYSQVLYPQIYPGVDVVFRGIARALEYDFILAPGASSKVIRLAFEGASGLRLDSQGDLVVSVRGREARQRKPVAYQEINGARKSVEVSYVLSGERQVALRMGPYDTSKAMVIDPVLSYSALVGDVLADSGNHVAVDSSGNAYVAGQTMSGLMITRTGTPFNDVDALVEKFDPSGNLLHRWTFHGNTVSGEDLDMANGIAVDGNGNIYVAGTTSSTNFPTLNAFSSNCGGPPGTCNQGVTSNKRESDAFILKIDSSGNLVYSTYFGGVFTDIGNAVAVDGTGMMYLTGKTLTIPIQAGFASPHTINACGADVYIAKFDPSKSGASSLVYSSMLGGDGDDDGLAIAVVPMRTRPFQPPPTPSFYVAGVTGETCFANLNTKFPTTTGAFAADGGLIRSAFLTWINPNNPPNTQIVYSTTLPGANEARGVATNTSRNAFITGSTNSFIATAGAFQTTLGGASDAYVAEFNPNGTGAASLVYTTLLGGLFNDVGEAIAVDNTGRATVTGLTNSSNFPLSADAIQTTNAGGSDAFVTRLNATGTALSFSTYLGGSSDDEGRGVAIGPGTIFVTGKTFSANFPVTVGAFHGQSDIFVVHITLGSDIAVTKTGTPDPVAAGQNVRYTITATNNGPDDSPGVTLFDAPLGVFSGAGTSTLVQYFSSQGSCTPPGSGVLTCNLGAMAKGTSATVTIIVHANGKGVLRNNVSVQGTTDDAVLSNNSAVAQNTVTATADLASSTFQTPANPIGLGTNFTYTVWAANNGPDLADPVNLALDLGNSGFTLVSYTPTQIPCSGTPVINCTIGPLGGPAPSITAQMMTFTFAPTITGSFPVTATVSGNADDPNPADNSTSVTTEVVQGQPELQAVVEYKHRISPTEVLILIQFRSNGTSPANNAILTQVQPQLLVGAGTPTYVSPTLPLAMGNLPYATHFNAYLTISAPTSIRTINLTESGTMQNAPGSPFAFTLTQKIDLP